MKYSLLFLMFVGSAACFLGCGGGDEVPAKVVDDAKELQESPDYQKEMMGEDTKGK